ncbi:MULTISPECIES: CDP-diacylglycerol--glycerol-3-phosphate 3-phosphatidyltransferase [unclassified Leptotrichia]|jgi:CDP-diacylglycerol--glycerol-3-phosphate 3-phosphatidyltransferase|uniref:CDP-diacylglycerol--glycerol-3-phosphate 3-phosphatidyltransferase n=1 Tax=unclassified Leptotrichia TaxID=2633022 RepID=UPI0017DEA7C4|nr:MULTISPECIES: CDP-diacylglycerol--glycerol-3-phosphate 3-phosphatidyltransferase [unclassified Leptotrichia]MBB1535362.1 CDP-diacylglycerol--glycerol-3-phosphate 3-phosphatidyltransferase [Leptotrichia sp.]QUB96462.1 CDP-diacylglycerol--glycerol-3-phosphate 3-phosphatidyltransferase [Leptotrichia sp. oral taxon 221]
MNLPNKLATLRMILVIPFVIFLGIALSTESTGLSIFMRILSFVIFAGASITDYFDGQIARKHNMVTNLGKLIDPLADKLLVISALVVLTKYDQISLWFVLIIIFRELLITGLRAIVANEGVVIAAEKLGKWKTATQMIALLLIILFPMSFFVNNILLLIPVILTVQSGVEYMQKAKNILNK